MVDAQARLIAVNTNMAGLNVDLAVPVHVVKKFLKEALGSERQPPEPLSGTS